MITRESFLAFYPQFSGFTPSLVIDAYICLANARFSTFLEDADEARRLYTAHKLTLYARAADMPDVPEGSTPTMSQLAASGEANHQVTSQKVGEVSVTYSSGAASSVKTAFADLTETAYGLQLLSLIKAHSFGMYIP